MYLYFDKNGVLLEMINDEALRQYNQDVNYMYVFIENSEKDSESFPIGLKYLEYWFELPDGTTTDVYTTNYHNGDEVVTEYIPPSSKRDVKKFEYGKRYKMHKIRIPCGELVSPYEGDGGALEYNVFELSGPVSVSIRAVYRDENNRAIDEDLTLGKVVFTIEEEVVVPSERLSVSQFQYLLGAVSGSIDVSNEIKRLDERLNTVQETYVPRRLSTFNETTGFRQNAYLFVDDAGKDSKISLRGIKDLNTKILTATDIGNFDTSKVVEGDYIYTEK